MRSFVVAISVCVAAIVASSSPAAADVLGDSWTDGGGVGAQVRTKPEAAGSSATGGPVDPTAPVCTYARLAGEDEAAAERFSQSPVGPVKGEGMGGWFREICTYPNGSTTGLVTWLAQNVDPVALAQQALDYSKLVNPTISASPGVGEIQIVRVPTWLWIDSASWNPITASASAGGVNATTTATPKRVIWKGGDGNTVVCSGPGKPYDKTKPDGGQRSDCTYSYSRSSASASGGRFVMSATQEWSVTWVATGLPAGVATQGNLGPVTRTSTVDMRVGEIQALNKRR